MQTTPRPAPIIHLIERFAAAPDRVDRAAGVLRGVKVLGLLSRNGRRYTPRALKTATAMYEGARVNVNHPSPGGRAGERCVGDRFGVLKNARYERGAIRADLHYLTRHPLAEMIAEAAERMPEALGLSHHAEGRTTRGAEGETVHEITRVVSVDLVSDPATTEGLFESSQRREYVQVLCGQSFAAFVSQ